MCKLILCFKFKLRKFKLEIQAEKKKTHKKRLINKNFNLILSTEPKNLSV